MVKKIERGPLHWMLNRTRIKALENMPAAIAETTDCDVMRAKQK